MTNFQDFPYRLGYACLNTILRKGKDENGKPVETFCSRTARISTAREKGIPFLQSLGLKNVSDMKKLIQWNEDNGIRFMRMSSDMFPYASHGELGYDLTFAKEALQEVGDMAKKLNHRLTTHPGQTNNLGSPRAEVVSATKRDLAYHAQMMDLMGLDADSVMIIHMGGMYESKMATMDRFAAEFATLPANVAARLVLENDEICYNTEELLPLCEQLEIPIVFDWHHHSLNPGTQPLEDILARVKAIWTQRGIRQKMHHSESRVGAQTLMERRAHSDYVTNVPLCGSEVDLMIEAKMKEQAVITIMNKYGVESLPK